MDAVLQSNRDAIAELCARYGVIRMDVFGSVFGDDFRPSESDVDLLVEFAPRDPYELATAYFDMLDELRRLLCVTVDLVMVGAVKNRYIAQEIERTSSCSMPRSALAYLSDVVEACDAVAVALDGVDLAAYEVNRTLRSAVEREFTIIGEAVNSMSRLDPELAARISHARMIVGFRNQLVHDYAAIIDATV